jgi:phenylpropionate dioxygenase-like ring-hydroxylating dioxygenase large terminal subunit
MTGDIRMSETEQSFKPGEFTVPGFGPKAPIEQKSPPLSALIPNRERYQSVDPARYTSVAEMRLEQERLWPKVWLWAGLVSDLPTVGSWLRYDTGTESIIVVRSGAQQFSAFYNVCQHRGNRLVDDEFGSQRSFICSYHSWAYDMQGKNKHVTDRRYFSARALCGGLDIPRVRCESFAGMIFVCMDDGMPPLREYLGKLAPTLEIYHLEQMFVIADIVLELEANWKTVVHAFVEAYHVHVTHPNVLPAFEDVKTQFDFYEGGHGRHISMRGTTTSRWPSPRSLTPAQESMLINVGVDPKTFGGAPGDVRRAIQLAKRRPDNVYGIDYSRFADSQLSDAWAPLVFPNSWWNLNPEGCLGLSIHPDKADPAKCRMHILGLAPQMPAGKKTLFVIPVQPDFDMTGKTRPKRQYVRSSDPHLKDVIGLTLWQDVRNLQESQAGMTSRGLKEIRLSELEQLIQHHTAAIDGYIRPTRRAEE